MKRSPITRSAPLRRGDSKLERRTRIRPINRERAAKKFERNFGEKASFVRSLPCLVSGCLVPSQAAHARARGMGGAKGDSTVLVPLCWQHHDEAGEYRTSDRAAFEARYGLDLMVIAGELEAQWQARSAA